MSTTSSSITLSWEPPPAYCQNGEITGYQIRFTNQSNLSPEEWSTDNVSGTAVGETIDGLEIFTEYFICIAARTSVDDYGPCSQTVNVTTLSECPLCVHNPQKLPSPTSPYLLLPPSFPQFLPPSLLPSIPSLKLMLLNCMWPCTQISMNALAVMGVNITVTTQLSHTTALAIVDGCYQAMAETAKVDKMHYYTYL